MQNSVTHATRTRRALFSALAVTALSFAGATVHAEATLPAEQVSLADLDLSRSDDAQRAYTRLSTAAKHVCRQLAADEPRGMRRTNQCYRNALANAVTAVGNVHLSQLHRLDRNVRLAQRGLNRTGAI
jgi:UrcA family protein